MQVYIKIHFSENRKVVAICDQNILGKTFSEGEKQLVVSERFFKGELVEFNASWKNELYDADSINFVGRDAIFIGLNFGMINKEEVLTIENVPYALVINA
ncbi:MAG TPA: DUF424 family protein [Candidatus Nanoarchaeia archaeon]|nr:DUF424 family protein [Candidatus Nanoarchaeia archaeon]